MNMVVGQIHCISSGRHIPGMAKASGTRCADGCLGHLSTFDQHGGSVNVVAIQWTPQNKQAHLCGFGLPRRPGSMRQDDALSCNWLVCVVPAGWPQNGTR